MRGLAPRLIKKPIANTLTFLIYEIFDDMYEGSKKEWSNNFNVIDLIQIRLLLMIILTLISHLFIYKLIKINILFQWLNLKKSKAHEHEDSVRKSVISFDTLLQTIVLF